MSDEVINIPEGGEIRIFDAIEPLADACAAFIAGLLESFAHAQGQASFALAGGSTPKPIYERLARAPISERMPYEHLSLYFGDERCVPADSADSNSKMAHTALFGEGHDARLAAVKIFPMEGALADHEGAADAYAALLPASLDVMLLGTGEDGHTASLFPGMPSLGERARKVIPVVGTKPPPQRLTVTPPVIEAARALVVAATGIAKSDVLARALFDAPFDQASTHALPIRLARRGVWFLDRAAASGIIARSKA